MDSTFFSNLKYQFISYISQKFTIEIQSKQII